MATDKGTAGATLASFRHALSAALTKLAAPLLLDADAVGTRSWWFSGTREEARASELLRGVGLPGDPGQNKCSWTAEIGGRQVRVTASGKHRVSVFVQASDAEAARMRAEDAEEAGAELSMKKAAEFDHKAAEAEAALAEQPATEAEFRQEAADMIWRMWTAIVLVYGSRRTPHASGFRYSEGTIDTLDGHITSALWALQHDGTVLFDHAVRTKRVREARADAARHDFPVQRLLKAAVNDAARELGQPACLPPAVA